MADALKLHSFQPAPGQIPSPAPIAQRSRPNPWRKSGKFGEDVLGEPPTRRANSEKKRSNCNSSPQNKQAGQYAQDGQDSPGTGKERVVDITQRKIKNPMRTTEDAGKLVKKHHEKLVPRIMRKYNLMGIVRMHFGKGYDNARLEGDVRNIVMVSIFHSARAWDSSREASFETYALSCGIECIAWVCKLIDPSITRRAYHTLGSYFKLRKEIPGYALDQFLSDKQFSSNEEAAVKAAYRALSGKGRCIVHADALLNGDVSNSDKSHSDFTPQNSFGGVFGKERMWSEKEALEVPADVGLAESRVRQILSESLNPRAQDMVCMHFGIGACSWDLSSGETATFEAIGAKYEISRQRIKQIVQKAIESIANSEYAHELREHLETIKRDKQKGVSCALGAD